MKTTVIHKGLRNESVIDALRFFVPIGLEIERLFTIRYPGYEIVLTVSVSGRRKRMPKLQIFLTKRCEIVSFEPEATMATSIVSMCRWSFTSDDGSIFFPLGVDRRKMFRSEVIKEVVNYFFGELR